MFGHEEVEYYEVEEEVVIVDTFYDPYAPPCNCFISGYLTCVCLEVDFF